MKMLRIVLVIATMTVMANARPSYIHSSVVPYGYELQPTLIGHTLHAYPSAVSHQSQTIIHEKRPYLRPIVEHVPVLQTSYLAPEIVSSPYYGGWDGGYGGYKSSLGGWNQW